MAETPEARKARLDSELAALKAKSNPTDAERERIAVIENAESEMPTPAEKVEANRDGGKPNLELRGMSVEERVKRLGFGS